ncbi:MAG: response regulator transcription factor [Oscillospiraceae bacterium]|jgi:two-component system response regulator VicR|nr:response regulator transcription factor [Oscillospiraceae bacterium]
MAKKVLIVDDEKAIVDILKYNLQKNEFETAEAYDGAEALRLARETDPDIILLDIMLPYMDGFEVCKALRDDGNNVPIIMLTAREDETDKVFGLEIGADDYITKPFSIRELMARVRANIRRVAVPAPAEEKTDSVIHIKDLTIDTDRHSVFRDGKEIDLTEREYNIIHLMAAEPGKVFTREELMREVWQYDYYGDLRTVDVAMRRFREKLEKNPAEPEYIITRRGAGYYFSD